MKRFGLFLLAAVLVAGIAGCGGDGDDDVDPVGTWGMFYAWTNVGTGSTVWHLYADKTFTSDLRGNRGTWDVSGDSIVVKYSGGSTYSGTISNDNAMSGTMIGSQGGTGTWTATKVSDTP